MSSSSLSPRRSALPVVVAVVAHADDGHVLTRTLLGVAHVRLCHDAADVERLVEQHRPSVLLVVIPDDGCGEALFAAVRHVRARWPTLELLTCAQLTPAAAAAVRRIAACGAEEVIFRDWGSAATAVMRLLEVSPDERLASGVLHRLRGWIPDEQFPVVQHCLYHAHAMLTVDRLAAAVELPRRTLAFRLRRAGLPSPERLIGWGRLFMAAARMERDGSSIERCGHEMGYASGAALRMLLKGYLGLTWGALRKRGGGAHLAFQFMSRFGRAAGRLPTPTPDSDSGGPDDRGDGGDPAAGRHRALP